MRRTRATSCYSPSPFEPPAGDLDFRTRAARATATELAGDRISESFRRTIALQANADLLNVRRGFFLVYINSFNEWHEGTQFEPMANAADLPDEVRRFDYHNVDAGSARLTSLAEQISLLE